MYADVPPKAGTRSALDRLDEVHAEAGRIDRLRLRAIYEADRAGAWQGEGHRDHASLLAARYGYSVWKARRMVAAAFAIERLPITSLALERGHIGLDKVIELTRFATAATEADLVAWATRVRSGAVRERADEACRARDEAERVQRSRSLTWSWEDSGSVLSLYGQLPAEGGRRFVEAVDRLARELPAEPEYDTVLDDDASLDERRADALILLTTASETGGERSTVVVHAPLDALRTGEGVAELAEGSSIAASTAQRIACDSKLEVVLYGAAGETVGIGRAAHDPPAWLRRQVLKRDDHSCSFPGCAMKRYLNIHHIEWWHEGGITDLDNLLTLCHFHHKLVHEYGWRVQLAPDGAKTWFRPGGTPYEPASVPEPPDPSDDDIPWGSLWHALKGEQPVEGDGFVRWSWKRGVDWIPSRT